MASNPQTGRMGRPSRTSIRFRLTMMAAVAVFAFLLLAISESIAVRSIIDRVEAEDVARRVHRARRVFEQRARSKANLISEFSFWDDTWALVDSPTVATSREHIRENFLEWLPERYGDRLIEIWSPNRQPVWRWVDSAYAGSDRIDHGPIFNQVETQRLSGGYVEGSRGLLLLAAALILRESDQTLQGPSNGYVLAAEPIDSVYLAQLEDELRENIRILPLPPTWSADSTEYRVSSNQDSIEARFAIPGFGGAPAALISMQSTRALPRQLAASTSAMLVATMLIGMLVLAILWRAGNRLVVRPLGEIGEALEAMQQEGGLSRIDTQPPTREWSIFVSAFNGTIEALKNSEKRYRLLFDHAADAHFLLDAHSQTILEANPAAEALAGRARAEMLGRPFSAVLRLEPLVASEGTYRLRKPDGMVLTVGVVTAEMELGGARRRLASLRDLTRSEALAAQLRQSQKMEAIGSLAGGIAHDFNNLLGAVLVASTTLKDEIGGNPAAVESLATIETASRRAAELTRGLLSFARREQRSTTVVNLNEVVRNVARLCQRTFDRAIAIEVDLLEPVPGVLGDSGQLEQVLLNLCINSRDAMPEGGIVRLATSFGNVTARETADLREVPPGPYVRVRVADTGSGLTGEAEQHLFEPFFTTKGPGKGTGLGLAMVYGLVRAHGGGIGVVNQPGEGVAFDVYLPSVTTEMKDAPSAQVGSPPGGSERLLIVDDEAALRASVSRALTRLGYTVAVAADGAQGARMVRESPDAYDLVILDMVMPEMGGTEAFHLIRRIRPDLPIMVCSGYSADAERSELLRLGRTGFLQKPFDTNDVARMVRQVLDER